MHRAGRLSRQYKQAMCCHYIHVYDTVSNPAIDTGLGRIIVAIKSLL